MLFSGLCPQQPSPLSPHPKEPLESTVTSAEQLSLPPLLSIGVIVFYHLDGILMQPPMHELMTVTYL